MDNMKAPNDPVAPVRTYTLNELLFSLLEFNVLRQGCCLYFALMFECSC